MSKDLIWIDTREEEACWEFESVVKACSPYLQSTSKMVPFTKEVED